MPIGSPDIAIAAGGNASALVESLFSTTGGSAPPRGFLETLINLANDASGGDYVNNNIAAFLQVPGLAPVVPATAAGFAGPAIGRALQCDIASLLNRAEAQVMLRTWSDFWIPPAAAAALPIHPSDAGLLGTLRGYLHDPTGTGAIPPFVMWEPALNYDGLTADGRLRLQLTGYNRANFFVGGAWVPATVTRFLQLLAFGAHFVVVHAPQDLTLPAGTAPPPAFFDEFVRLCGAASRRAKAHSHYGGLGPVTNIAAAYTYPSLINAETTPANCPYVTAFLAGRTDWSFRRVGLATWAASDQFNTFFQLEGWPATGATGGIPQLSGVPMLGSVAGGGRHGADYNTHSATKWSISTYGASVYSEKRGTTVFLAPPPPMWGPPTPAPGTIMAPYTGALTPQRWLDTTLIR